VTQRDRILHELREAGSAGVRGDVFLRLSMPRYAARILELRAAGYEIGSETDDGMARYKLISDKGVGVEAEGDCQRAPADGLHPGEPAELFPREAARQRPRSAFTDQEWAA
jgi:hypothetical protein